MTNGNPQGNEGVERVTLDDVLRETDLPSGREVGPLTRIGYRLAIILLVYLGVVTSVLLIDHFTHAPSLPSGSLPNADQLSQYQQVSEIVTERTMKLLDALVLKGFLPVLTAVLGYIFGTRGAEHEAA
jgi:hypothetical protein